MARVQDRVLLGLGGLVVAVLIGCSDANPAKSSGGVVVPPEVESSSGDATGVLQSETTGVSLEEVSVAKADALLAALATSVDLAAALRATALRARIDSNGQPVILDFHGRHLTDDGLGRLKDQVKLEQLFLGQQAAITDIGLEHLKGLTVLKRLSLEDTSIGDSNLEALSGLKTLQHLNLSGTQVSSVGLEQIKALTALVELKLSSTAVTDAGLAQLKPLTRLQRLDLSNTEVSSAGLESLVGLKLQELHLAGTRVDDSGLGHLKAMTTLRRLHLSSGIGDAGLLSIQPLRGLEFLSVGGSGTISDTGVDHLKSLTRLRRLDLSGTGLTDSGLLSLKVLSNLERLDLAGTRITDSGLRHLRGLVKLRELDLTGTRMRSGAVRQLQAALPACRIIGVGGDRS